MSTARAWGLLGAVVVVLTATEADGAEARLARVVLLRSADRLSIALEMTAEPERAALRPLSSHVIEVEAGPVSRHVREQDITPVGVPFIKHVSIREHGVPHQPVFVRARVILQAPGQANVRVTGRVIYIDFVLPERASTLPTFQEVSTSSREPSDRAAGASVRIQPRGLHAPGYEQRVSSLIARLDEIRPFLLSAVAKPSADVLQAVGRTLSAVEEPLRELQVPPTSRPLHDLLTSGVALAGRAVAPDFRGSRVAEAGQALALIDAVKGEIQ